MAKSRKHSRYRKEYHRALDRFERRRREKRIPAFVLTCSTSSSMANLINTRNDQSYITSTGFDYETFENLHQNFKSIFDTYTIMKNNTIAVRTQRGRPRGITSKLCLALTLYYTRTKGGLWSLQIPFSMSYTSLCRWLKFGQRVIVTILKHDPLAKLRDRTPEEWESYVSAIGRKHPILGRHRVGATLDGMKMNIESSPHGMVQSMFYNGWMHGHYVTNVFVFGPDGTIIMAAMNAPGCLHDSTITTRARLYEKMQAVFDELGIRFTVDDAFNSVLYEYLIKSGEKNRGMSLLDELLNQEATSMRQSAEWGMRGFRASFPRSTDRILYEESGGRYIFINLLVLLYNYRYVNV